MWKKERRGNKEGHVQHRAREKAFGCGGGWQKETEQTQEGQGAYERVQGRKHIPDVETTPKRQQEIAGKPTRPSWTGTATMADEKSILVQEFHTSEVYIREAPILNQGLKPRFQVR